MKARVLSGVQPTGQLHIGNYLGALKSWAEMQSRYESIFCIVDLHAVTLYQKPEELRAKIRETAALFVAAGIDPDQSSVVVQSSIPGHSELAWLLTCVTPLGWLQRMTQFKAKAEKQESLKESIGAGLLQYPVLMAADILLYQAAIVPVGEDQTQHLELTRDIAQRFNSLYGETFVMPATRLPTVGARIMGLDDPAQKMSKSAEGAGHAIALLDDPKVIQKKILRATTDSQPAVDPSTMGPGIQNLLAIGEACDASITKESVTGMRYGDFKKRVAEAVIARLEPIQRRYREITADPAYIDAVLEHGREHVLPISENTVRKVKEAMGIYVQRLDFAQTARHETSGMDA
jgi:tryptophanyl-tRNA synthetase